MKRDAIRKIMLGELSGRGHVKSVFGLNVASRLAHFFESGPQLSLIKNRLGDDHHVQRNGADRALLSENFRRAVQGSKATERSADGAELGTQPGEVEIRHRLHTQPIRLERLIK